MTFFMHHKFQGYLAVLFWLILAHPNIRTLLELSPSLHMLVQIPALALTGAGLAPLVARTGQHIVHHMGLNGVAGVLAAIFCALFWMIPRSLDAALDSDAYEAAKFLSLPLLLGLPLRLSWPEISPVFRAFISAQFIAMLTFLGWLYAASPIRLCNNYLASEQTQLGMNLLLVAAFLAVTLGIRFLLGPLPDTSNTDDTPQYTYKRKSDYVC